MRKIYNKITIGWNEKTQRYDNVLYEDSFQYGGPVMSAHDDGTDHVHANIDCNITGDLQVSCINHSFDQNMSGCETGGSNGDGDCAAQMVGIWDFGDGVGTQQYFGAEGSPADVAYVSPTYNGYAAYGVYPITLTVTGTSSAGSGLQDTATFQVNIAEYDTENTTTEEYTMDITGLSSIDEEDCPMGACPDCTSPVVNTEFNPTDGADSDCLTYSWKFEPILTGAAPTDGILTPKQYNESGEEEDLVGDEVSYAGNVVTFDGYHGVKFTPGNLPEDDEVTHRITLTVTDNGSPPGITTIEQNILQQGINHPPVITEFINPCNGGSCVENTTYDFNVSFYDYDDLALPGADLLNVVQTIDASALGWDGSDFIEGTCGHTLDHTLTGTDGWTMSGGILTKTIAASVSSGTQVWTIIMPELEEMSCTFPTTIAVTEDEDVYATDSITNNINVSADDAPVLYATNSHASDTLFPTKCDAFGRWGYYSIIYEGYDYNGYVVSFSTSVPAGVTEDPVPTYSGTPDDPEIIPEFTVEGGYCPPDAGWVGEWIAADEAACQIIYSAAAPESNCYVCEFPQITGTATDNNNVSAGVTPSIYFRCMPYLNFPQGSSYSWGEDATGADAEVNIMFWLGQDTDQVDCNDVDIEIKQDDGTYATSYTASDGTTYTIGARAFNDTFKRCTAQMEQGPASNKPEGTNTITIRGTLNTAYAGVDIEDTDEGAVSITVTPVSDELVFHSAFSTWIGGAGIGGMSYNWDAHTADNPISIDEDFGIPGMSGVAPDNTIVFRNIRTSDADNPTNVTYEVVGDNIDNYTVQYCNDTQINCQSDTNYYPGTSVVVEQAAGYYPITFSFTPAQNYFTTPVGAEISSDEFTIVALSSDGSDTSETMYINIWSINEPPVVQITTSETDRLPR